jgi:hypothetical protein
VSDPRAVYSVRLGLSEAAYAAAERRHVWIGNLKLAVVGVGMVVAWLVFGRHVFFGHGVAGYWLILVVGIYGGLAAAHEVVLRGRRRAQTAAEFYRRGMARMEDRWAGSGTAGEQFRDAEHVYAEDLDLFGRGCMFELLCTARLPMGESWLARWLKSPSRLEEVLERQGLVAELRGKLELHQDLAITGEELRPRIASETLIEWAEGKTVLPAGVWRVVAASLALAAAGAVVLYFESVVYWPVLLGVLVVEGALWVWLRGRMKEAIAGLDCNAEGLELFARVLERLEGERFVAERLRGMVGELRGGLASPGDSRRMDHASSGAEIEGPPQKADPTTASEAVRRLARVVYWAENRENLMAKIAEWPFLYTLQVAFAAEAWKRRWGGRMRAWMNIAGEMEALVALAIYSFEHPGDVFPEFAEAGEGRALFDGEELGHPLIAAAKCVRNSVRLHEQTRVLLISGSNMSGKSTLLRTVGINAVLAMAGAPIRGKSLRLTAVNVGTRIRSTDSLQEGRSTFYTEILHIRRVFALLDKPEPLLFLFDELLEGTNSHDRRIGAEKLLRALLEGGAMGMVTTHDLALTEIGGAIGEGLRNVHFEDFVEEGKMRFDYRLRDGVVTKSNAIELMRVIGLDV